MFATVWPASRARARAIPLAADATVPAAPAARRNDRRLHILDLIKNLLDLSGVHFEDDIIRERGAEESRKSRSQLLDSSTASQVTDKQPPGRCRTRKLCCRREVRR